MKPSLSTRLRWWLDELRNEDAKVVAGVIVVAALVLGGFLAARTVAQASSGRSAQSARRVVTLRQRIRVRVHGHVVTRWRLRKGYAKQQTVMETQTVHTPNGVRLVTRPVVRNHVVYRKHVVRVNGKTRTVLQPVTTTRTVTNSTTQVVTTTRQGTTQVVTVTKPVTTTVVSTEIATQPVTVTVTVTTHGHG